MYIATSGDSPGATAAVGGAGASGDSPPYTAHASFISDTAEAEVSQGEDCWLPWSLVVVTVSHPMELQNAE